MPQFKIQQQQLVNIIKSKSSPDMIFILASSTYHISTESIFKPPLSPSFHNAGYILLVLISNDTYKELQCWQEKLEHHCKAITPVTTMVLLTSSFAEWLTTGHSFARTVMSSATCIYDAGTVILPPPAAGVRAEDKEQGKHYEIGLQRSKTFLAGAELYRLREQYDFAAFMLHQATEQCLRTLLKIGTGYHCNIHSLDRLFRYCTLVSTHLQEVFSGTGETDKKLFQLLQKAYIDCRYGSGFNISAADIETMTVKVTRLQEILVLEAARILQQTSTNQYHEN